MNYFITAIYDEPGLFVHRKARRTFGYFSKLDEALKAVQENRCNMQECLYNYLVIEGIGEGIHALVEEEYWFTWEEWQHQAGHCGWHRISSKPELFNGTINFALG